ncbi:MAG TPA: DinB family protein [Chryseolinea sp.]
MKTVYDKDTRDELIRRINTPHENSTAQWGKMKVYQMVKHCRLWEEMMLGKAKYDRVFIGRIFGKMALNNMLKNEAPMGRNAPTIPELIIKGEGDISIEKSKWIALIEEHGHAWASDLVHPFFGKLTKEQTGRLVYKHDDHHLRQFNS